MRKKQSARGAAEPTVYGAGSMDYQDYLKIPDLLSLQKPQSKPAHHDEMLFIIIHQAYELWFKLLTHELESAIHAFRKTRLEDAHHRLRRVARVLHLLVDQIHLLETMRPVDFLRFRDHLKPASGFQSVQFREIEFLLGLKEPAYLKFFKGRTSSRRRLERRLEGPDVGFEFLRALKRSGSRIPPEALRGTVAANTALSRRVARALLPIYRSPQRHPSTYGLLETLLEIDNTFQLWRQHHVGVVERIIGAKPGTGGSSGVSYLRTTTAKRCFPYLWELRTLLEL